MHLEEEQNQNMSEVDMGGVTKLQTKSEVCDFFNPSLRTSCK